jgi:hypothetical protein
MTHIISHLPLIPSSDFIDLRLSISLTLERYLVVDSRILSRKSKILILNFHPFPLFCSDNLSENPWRLFAFPLHRCCHQLALLEIVLIIGVCNGYVKAYWIPNSCRHSFHCVDLVLASLRLPISLSHLDPSSVIIVSPLVSLTSSISASSILAVYFRTTKQTYG